MRPWIVVLVGLALTASAEESSITEEAVPAFTWNLKNHSLLTSTKNLDDSLSPHLLRSETHARGEVGHYNLGVILANRFAVASPDGADVPFYIEKKHLSFENDQWQVILGDSHQELGRGIALALFRDETFGIDSTVEGASVKLSSGGWEFKTFGGRARTLRAPVALLPFQSPLFGRELFLVSASARYKWTDTDLGAHYLMTLNRPIDLNQIDKRWHTIGATVTLNNLAPGWDVYAESNILVNERVVAPFTPQPTGHGTYASVVYAPLPWKFKLEVKDYRDYNYDFSRPPTMEEDIVTSLNFSNVTAARFLAERKMSLYNSIRASLLWGDDRVAKTTVRHAVLAGKMKLGSVNVEARSGYRWMDGQSDLLHGDVKFKIPTRAGQFLELGYRKLHAFNNLNFRPILDDRNFLDLAYTFSSNWGVTLGLEYLPSNPVNAGRVFANAGTLFKIGSLTARAFIGATSGGPQCSGGICRMVPAYSGGMLEGTYVF